MGNFFSDLFEPSGGGTERESLFSGGQTDVLKQLTDLLKGQIGQGVTPFQGQRVAGFSPLQQQAFRGFSGLGGLGQSLLDIGGQSLQGFDPSQSQGFLGQAQNALTQGLQGVDTQAISDAFAPSRQLALNQFQQQTIPDLLERFGASSGGSGALQQQLAQAGGNLSLGLSAQQAPFIGQAALQAPGLQQQGAGLAGNLAQLPGQIASQGAQLGAQGSNFLSQLLGVGGLQQQQEQAQLGAEQQRFDESQAFNNPFLNLLATALGSTPFQAFQKASGPSMFSQVSGAAGQATGSGGAFGTQGAFGPFTG